MKLAHLSDFHYAGPLWSKTDLITESQRIYREGGDLIQAITSVHRHRKLKDSLTDLASLVTGELETVHMRRMLALKSRLFWNPLLGRVMRWCLGDLQEQGVDCVIFTGDFTSAARPSEFRAIKPFLTEIKQHHGLIIVPGNHDLVYPIVFNPRLQHRKRLHYFMNYLGWLLPEGLDDGEPYPLFYFIDDKFCCIALDSTYLERLSLEAGSLMERQFAMVTQFLEQGRHEGRTLIFALHHAVISGPARVKTRSPVLNKFLKNAEDQLITLIPENESLIALASRFAGSLILHGHKHQEFLDRSGDTVIHCAGTSLRPDLLQQRPPGYSIFEYIDSQWVKTRRNFPSGLLPITKQLPALVDSLANNRPRHSLT